jgi:hypothetical protein
MSESIHLEEQAPTASRLEGLLPREDGVDELGLLPLLRPVSGLYTWSLLSPLGAAEPATLGNGAAKTDGAAAGPAIPLPIPLFRREELRLDVDGRYPQMAASGTITHSLATRVDWIARLARVAPNTWEGPIWYKDGAVGVMPYTTVRIKVVRGPLLFPAYALVTYSGGGTAPLTRMFRYRSPSIRPIDLEFDCAQGTTGVTQINTHDHPNRPPTLPAETLTIETVFRRAGFQVTRSGGDNIVPMIGAGPDARWSDAEMHDAMQAYWSKFANKPQWAMWVFFASLHEMGTSLGGIMFDDIGPNHRQGTAIFVDAFIATPPAGDPAPDAWVRRMRFWTAVHEMGHTFNLAHSWQKSLIYQGHGPWIPLNDEPEARSFMNYPYNVSGGQSAFFADFEFRFSDGELLFMRHAPLRFVQQGNAEWFDHHGFQQANVSPEPALKLELRAHRQRPTARYELMEPVVLELKLTNISGRPQTINRMTLAGGPDLTVIIKRDGQPARRHLPYATYCGHGEAAVLHNGQSIYESLFVAAGQGGWLIADPGWYTVQVALQHNGEDIVSNPLRLRVGPPANFDEQRLTQDFFSDEVGRVLAFDGSRYLHEANEILREVAEKLGNRRAALHARIALGHPLTRPYKLLEMGDRRTDTAAQGLTSAAAAGARIVAQAPDEDEAQKDLEAALLERPAEAAESLSHIDYNNYMSRYSTWLAEQGDRRGAADALDTLYETLAARGVRADVLQDIADRREELSGAPAPERRRERDRPRAARRTTATTTPPANVPATATVEPM